MEYNFMKKGTIIFVLLVIGKGNKLISDFLFVKEMIQ